VKEKIEKYFKGDMVIWIIILILSIFSMLTVYSATGTLAYKKMGGNTSYFLFRHLTFIIVGFVITFLVHNISYKFYYKLAKLLLYLSVPMLAWTLFRGTNLNDASRWITLPGTGLSFQTSDLAKFALIMYVAGILGRSQQNIGDINTVLRPILFWVLVVCGLILPANFSTAAMLFFICLVLMFIGRIPLKYIGSIVGFGVVALTIFILVASKLPDSGRLGTWKSRVESFTSNDSDGNYQANQAKIAIVNGRYLGRGPGNSIQRNFLPHPYSDFIFAIVVEEYGLIGALTILALYLMLLFRVGAIVRKSQRTFPAFLVTGLALSIVIQALINMGVAVNIFPVTGQTLPLVSMGGTSMIFTSAAFGIILSISRTVQAESANTEEQLGENFIEPELEDNDYEDYY